MKRTSLLVSAALVLPLTLVGCGDSTPTDPLEAGDVQLQDQDYAAAATSYQAAMDGAEKGSDDWRAAAVGVHRAKAHTDPASASAGFIALAADEATGLDEGDYSDVLGALYESKAYLDALQIAHAGKTRWPDSAKMDTYISKLQEKAEGDPALSSALDGFGYGGGDD